MELAQREGTYVAITQGRGEYSIPKAAGFRFHGFTSQCYLQSTKPDAEGGQRCDGCTWGVPLNWWWTRDDARAALLAEYATDPAVRDRLLGLVGRPDGYPPATQEQRQLVKMAMRDLTQRTAQALDDQGFNRYDAKTGARLAALTRPLTDAEVWLGTNLVLRYRRQLPADVLDGLHIGKLVLARDAERKAKGQAPEVEAPPVSSATTPEAKPHWSDGKDNGK